MALPHAGTRSGFDSPVRRLGTHVPAMPVFSPTTLVYRAIVSDRAIRLELLNFDPTMSHNYDDLFGSNDAANNDDDSTTTQSYEVRKWKLGDHTARPTTSESGLKTDAAKLKGVDDELAELFEAAAARVPDMRLYDFECPVCGLGHGHSDDKHDVRDAFNVTQAFAEAMEFNPTCHCGVNELAMLMDFFGHIQTRVFTDEHELTSGELQSRFDDIRSAASAADIADTTEARIEEIRASLEDRFDDDDESPVGETFSGY